MWQTPSSKISWMISGEKVKACKLLFNERKFGRWGQRLYWMKLGENGLSVCLGSAIQSVEGPGSLGAVGAMRERLCHHENGRERKVTQEVWKLSMCSTNRSETLPGNVTSDDSQMIQCVLQFFKNSILWEMPEWSPLGNGREWRNDTL